MNYEPNQAAVSLATRRSRKIGIIISDLTNPHISSLFMAIEREIQKNGYMLLCHVLENEPAENTISYLQRMLSNDIAGLIWCKPIVETPPRSARRQDGSSM
ncbi:MAG: hypothetical protein LUI07_03305, partial [Lachnospiraceae bacterium]|nr:hypothetical protein [Lachnospiraceae bacterium]